MGSATHGRIEGSILYAPNKGFTRLLKSHIKNLQCEFNDKIIEFERELVVFSC